MMVEAANVNFSGCSMQPLIIDTVDPTLIVDPLDQQVCQQVAQSLTKYYPGHDWLVEADRRKGLLDIRNLRLSGGMGCRFPLSGYVTASELDRLAMRLGGELLERYAMPRRSFDRDAYETLPENAIGEHVHAE